MSEQEYVADVRNADEDSVPPEEVNRDMKNYDNIPVGAAQGYVPEDELNKSKPVQYEESNEDSE